MKRQDLIVLVADRDMRSVLEQVLKRPLSLGMRPVESVVISESLHDPACAIGGVQALTEYEGGFDHAILMFDHEGSGREQESPQEIEASLDAEFQRSAWDDRARTVVVSPELEVWLWGGSPHVDRFIGWTDRPFSLRRWLAETGWWPRDAPKPLRPKEAFQAATRETGVAARTRVMEKIARRASLRRCSDRAFLRLRDTLREWFPPDGS